MSLAHAILGILTIQPMTGYDMKTQAFDGAINHFWPADQAQIYRTLDKLAEQGWVEYELEVQHDRPNRKIYRLTEAGRAEFARWLHEPQPPPLMREPTLLQVFFGAQLSNAELTALLEQQIARHEAKLAEYERIPLPPLESAGLERRQLLAGLTLELGKAIEAAYLKWLREAVARLAPPEIGL